MISSGEINFGHWNRGAMKISRDTSDRAAMQELGSRIARYRLGQNLTQATLAAQAGVSTPTVLRLEQGRSTQAANFIRILRALKLLGNLESLIPEPGISPVQQAAMPAELRERASAPSALNRRRRANGLGDAP